MIVLDGLVRDTFLITCDVDLVLVVNANLQCSQKSKTAVSNHIEIVIFGTPLLFLLRNHEIASRLIKLSHTLLAKFTEPLFKVGIFVLDESFV